MQKIVSHLTKSVHLLYAILTIGILFATIIIDKRLTENAFPNEATWPNAVCYLIALFLLVCIVFLLTHKCNKGISKRTFYVCLTLISLGTMLIQIVVSVWTPTIITETDFGRVRDMAILLADGGSFAGSYYFELCSNQVNIALLLSLVYRLFHSWRFVIWMGATLMNCSALLTGLTVFHLTRDRRVALICCICSEFLFALSWRAFMPYTDNWAIIFGTLFVMLSFLHIRLEYKLPLLTFVGLLGTWIKPTILIIVLAMTAYAVSRMWDEDKKTPRFWTNPLLLPTVTVCVLMIVIGTSFSNYLWHSNAYQETEETYGWQYYFMLGQNNYNTGQVMSAEFSENWKLIHEQVPGSERMAACQAKAMEWIRERGVIGNLVFYTKVLNVCFNDGRFHNVQPYDHATAEHGLIYDLYANDGKYYSFLSNTLQILWDGILIVIAAGFYMCVRKKQIPNEAIFFEIFIIGMVLYQFVFEDRSKYLFMFLPLIISFSGLLLSRILALLRQSLRNEE